MTVVGGTYCEKVLSPEFYELYGSGLRAATWLSVLDDVRLFTVCYQDSEELARQKAETMGVELLCKTVTSKVPTFLYKTPISGAVYYCDDTLPGIEWQNIKDDVILQFGMLEGACKVTGKKVVYDPQSPSRPRVFWGAESCAEELVMIMNYGEAKSVWGQGALKEGIQNDFNAHTNIVAIVIKNGPFGATVYTRTGGRHHIPAFVSDSVFSVGSGDVFSATFTHFWGIKGDDPVSAATKASKAVSVYVQSRGNLVPLTRQLIDGANTIAVPEKKMSDLGGVYLAAPFFNAIDLTAVDEIRTLFHENGIRVFSPYHDVGIGDSQHVYERDIEGIKNSGIVFANVCGFDPGTVYEIGYAAAIGKPVVAYAEGCERNHLTMLGGGKCRIYTDFTSSFYNAIWTLMGT